jgi:thiol-disulfide isomerase/thioredoxin
MNMKKLSIRDWLIAGFLAAVVIGIAYVWLSPAGIQPAPALSMKSLPGGNPIDLAKLRGRPVLVTFWATSCPGCIKEMPHLIELYKELNPKGLEIIGIAMNYDRPDHVMAMQKSKQIPYPIAWDGTSAASNAFGRVTLTPTSFLIDPNGQIVSQTIGEMDMDLLHARILTMLSGSKTS